MMWYEVLGIFIVGMGGTALSILVFLWKDSIEQSKQWIQKELKVTYWTRKDCQTQAFIDTIRFMPMSNRNETFIDDIKIK